MPEHLVSCKNLNVRRRQRRNFQKLSADKKPWELGFNAKFLGLCRKKFFNNFSCTPTEGVL